MKLLAFLLSLTVILILMEVKLPRWDIKSKFESIARGADKIGSRKDTTAKEFVARVDGRRKQGFATKAYSEAKQVYSKIGQEEKYYEILQLALLSGAIGATAGETKLAGTLPPGRYRAVTCQTATLAGSLFGEKEDSNL